jgi:RNA polymerase sigma factor (sigma-70 family)
MQMHLNHVERNDRGDFCGVVFDGNARLLNYDALLASARQGDERSFEQLCEHASPRIFRTLTRITKNREDAEDALQEALMRAFINLSRFDGRSSFSTWLTRIAINAAFMKLRRSRLSREVSMDGTDPSGKEQTYYQFRDQSPNPEDKYAAHERGAILRDALSGLRPRVRAAVEIYQLQERSLKETAKLLGISVAAAKGRLFQAKAALRKASRTKTIGELRFRHAA